MANLTDVSNFDGGVYQLAVTDIIQGGPGGVSNAPQQNLANRTRWLYNNTLQLSGGAMTGLIVGAAGGGEFARLLGSGPYISGFDPTDTTRTGFLQFDAGASVNLAAEGVSALYLMTAGVVRLSALPGGQVVVGSTASLTGSLLDVNGTLGFLSTTNTLTGIVGASGVTDTFTYDTNKLLHSFGLSWKTFSDAARPCAALTGYGGLRFITADSVLAMHVSQAGIVGFGAQSQGAIVDIAGNAVGALQATLTRGGGDTNFQLSVRNGSGTTQGSEHARFGLEYHGVGTAAGLSFRRGATQTDGMLTVQTATTDRVFFDATGNTGFGAVSPGSKVYVSGDITLTGNVFGAGFELSPTSGSIPIPGLIASAGTALAIGSNAHQTIILDATGTLVGIGVQPTLANLQVAGSIYASGSISTLNGYLYNGAGALQLTAAGTNRLTFAVAGTIWGSMIAGAFEIGGADSGNGGVRLTAGGTANSGYVEFFAPAGVRAGYFGFSPAGAQNPPADTGTLVLACGLLQISTAATINGSAVVKVSDFVNNQAISTTGHITLPGGTIQQWQDGTPVSAEGQQTITFAQPFQNACVHVQVTTKYPTGDAACNAAFQIVSISRTAVVLMCQNDSSGFPSGPVTPTVFAIGN